MSKRITLTEGITKFIQENAAVLKDEEAAKRLSELLGSEVKVATYRRLRKKLGIEKSRGRGVCRVATPTMIEEVAAPTASS